jgi:hypothetical protein
MVREYLEGYHKPEEHLLTTMPVSDYAN